eukprot:TRINITY_DN19301_c1_g2_i1.p1 TRINITY_DN19301_c1_g2~~TRINITY_DN19301_c1_g2_i1.p1  ORF type:complete len:243 (-),score=27.71 TRINITY_DN19301_c1_g2_i1:33-686(-)
MSPECSASRDPFWEIVKSAITGTLSSILSDGMLVLLIAVRGEQCPELAVLEADEPDHWSVHALLQRARSEIIVKLLIFWSMAIAYTVLSMYVTVCFLANVGHADALGFMWAYFVVLGQVFVVTPLLIALFFASMCTLALFCSPDMVRRCCEEGMRVHTSQAAQSAEDVDFCAQLSNILPQASQTVKEVRALSKTIREQLARLENALPGQLDEPASQA